MMINYQHIFSSMRLTVTIIASIILVKYFIYLVIAPLYPVKMALWREKIKRLKRKGKLPQIYKPLVSIIIPAWNEEVGIIATIKTTLSNTYDNLEIIVVDDGSTDNTAKLVEQFLKKYREENHKGKTVRFFSKENGGKASAMNYGVKKSKGDIILTMDADSVHDSKTVENIVHYFEDPTVDSVVGNVKVSNTRTLIGLLQHIEYTFGFYFKRVHSVFDAEYIFGGACSAYRKATTFDKIGNFDTSNKTEDIEYSMRTKLYGLKSVYAEDAIVYTEGASALKSLYKQRLRWKKGRMDTFIKYRSLFFSTDSKHSKFLTLVVLPYALLTEVQMLFEPLFFTLIWTYTIVTQDYLSLGISSLFIMFSFMASMFFGDKRTRKLYVVYFPSFWLIFYGLVAIEFLALIKSIEMLLNNEDVVWQKWKREGVGINYQFLSNDIEEAPIAKRKVSES